MIFGFHVKYPLFLSHFNETLILSTDFRKIIVKFHENPYTERRVVPCGQMDKLDEAKSRFSQFCE